MNQPRHLACQLGLAFVVLLHLGVAFPGLHVAGNHAIAQQVIRYRPAVASTPSRSLKSTRPKPGGKNPYRLDAGDYLAVIVDGIVGSLHEAKVHLPKPGDGTLPALGTPVPVLKDGTLGLPLIAPLSVRGLTVGQAKSKIDAAYRELDMISRDNVVMVSLLRKRTIDVRLLHDQPDRGYVDKVRLEAATASIPGALANSSGFDPRGKVTIVGRGRYDRLRDRDLIRIDSDSQGFFFAGGSLTPGQYRLPNDRPVDALQAISIAGGTRNAKALDPLIVTIVSPTRGRITVPYRNLLRNSSAYQIHRGDTVILR